VPTARVRLASAYPPVNWRAIVSGPSGTGVHSGRQEIDLQANVRSLGGVSTLKPRTRMRGFWPRVSA